MPLFIAEEGKSSYQGRGGAMKKAPSKCSFSTEATAGLKSDLPPKKKFRYSRCQGDDKYLCESCSKKDCGTCTNCL